MEKIVAANLKMNMTADETREYLDVINNLMNDHRVIICPTNIYLPYYLNNKYALGIQNVSIENSGAYTGEVSPLQARSLGVEYAIIGHSERRKYYNENDEIVNKKIAAALNNDLRVILCIGETLEQKDANLTKKILTNQLEADLKDIVNIDRIIIAYEPIWAIGTNKIPTNDEIKEVVNLIKEVVNRISNIDIQVLYGGSVNEKNIKEINEIPNLTGVLVGGASLIPSKLNIIKEVVLD